MKTPLLTVGIWRPVYEQTTLNSRGWTVIEHYVTEVNSTTLRQAFWKAWLVGAARIGDKLVVDPDCLAWQYLIAEDGIWSLDNAGRKYQISEDWTRLEKWIIKALRLGLPR